MKSAKEWAETPEFYRDTLRMVRAIQADAAADMRGRAAKAVLGLSNDEFARNRDEDGDTPGAYFDALQEAERAIRALPLEEP
jgi:hypothetical protein